MGKEGAQPNTRPPKVFISYSRDSAEHMERVRALADRLRADGVDACIDQYERSPAEGWPRWTIGQITEADFVLVVPTAAYAQRADKGERTAPRDLPAGWEGAVLTRELQEAPALSEKIIPVLFSPNQEQYIPVALSGLRDYDLSQPEGYEKLYRRLTGQLRVSKPEVGRPRSLPPRKPQRYLVPSTPKYPTAEVQDLSRALEEAYQRREEMVVSGRHSTIVDAEILELRRRLRQGPHLQAGEFLDEGRFGLIEQIGRGGFATVWKAYDRKNQELVAIKVLHGQLAEDRSRRERFFRGARKMAELRHRDILRVIEAQREDGGWFFFVMEYASRGDLRQAVLARRLSLEQRLQIVEEVGEALEFAHSQGMIHRDVKPANILLDADDKPKLTDFDLVRAFDTTGGTRTEGMMGTFLYAAPEAMQDPKHVGVAADVYSLGMTSIFVIHEGELPAAVMRDAESFIAILDCSTSIKQVLAKAVDWDTDKRFGSIAEFLSAFQYAREHPFVLFEVNTQLDEIRWDMGGGSKSALKIQPPESRTSVPAAGRIAPIADSSRRWTEALFFCLTMLALVVLYVLSSP